MSMAMGGMRIDRCRLCIDPQRMSVSLVGNGMHVFYRALNGPATMTAQQAAESVARMQVFEMGSVRAAGHHEGWKHAVWVLPEHA